MGDRRLHVHPLQFGCFPATITLLQSRLVRQWSTKVTRALRTSSWMSHRSVSVCAVPFRFGACRTPFGSNASYQTHLKWSLFDFDQREAAILRQ